MKIDLEPGVYVVAVSGGVDSMVLLRLLSSARKFQNSKYQFIVAHFEHGIREDSDEDLELVREVARARGMQFVYDRGYLGEGASEDKARQVRYEFLRSVKSASGAKAIITAHHQDDLLETAILNLLRGTNRRGLSSLKSAGEIIRPLLGFGKQEIKNYAVKNKLEWHEDSTNDQIDYRRNYVRQNILGKFDEASRQELLSLITEIAKTNEEIDDVLEKMLRSKKDKSQLDRNLLIMAPHKVSREIIAAWLRENDLRAYDTRMLERLVVNLKTLGFGKKVDIYDKNFIEIDRREYRISR